MTSTFPCVTWGASSVSFIAGAGDAESHETVRAALVFVCWQSCFCLADIAGRGWTIPGGRCEPGEPPDRTAVREAYEEAGAVISNPTYIGRYRMSRGSGSSTESVIVPVYMALAERLDPLPPGSESLGVRLVHPGELKDLYYMWDDLIEAVCRYARRCAAHQGWCT